MVTSGAATRVEGEVYPIALIDPSSTFAGLGIALAYDRSFGLDLQFADQSTLVDQSYERIGARYRTHLGDAGTLMFGVDYARRQFAVYPIAHPPYDPSVDYSSIDPVLGVNIPVASRAAIFAALNAMLIRDAGPITDNANFGHAIMYGLGATGGIELLFSGQIRLRLALEYLRIAMSFDTATAQTAGRDGDMSTRDITGATEHSFGVVATVGMAY